MFEGYPNEYNQADPFNSFSNGMNEQQAWARQQEIYAAEQRAEEERKRREQEEKDNFWSNPIIDAKTARENREKNAMMYNLAEKSAEFNRGRDRKIGNTANRIVITESAAQEKAAQAKVPAQEAVPVDTAQTTPVEVSQAAPEATPVDVPEAAPAPAENEQTKQSEAAPIVAPAEQQPATGFDENGHPIDDVIEQTPATGDIEQAPTISEDVSKIPEKGLSIDDLPQGSTMVVFDKDGRPLFRIKRPTETNPSPAENESDDEPEPSNPGDDIKNPNARIKFKAKVAALMVAASAFIFPLFGCAISEGEPQPDEGDFGTSTYTDAGTLPHNVGPNIVGDDYGTGAIQGETETKESGIIDGYNDAGMFGTVKDGTSFADAEVLSKEYGNDEELIIEAVGRKQAESLADYIVNMPDGIKPAWAKGMTELEAESYIEGLDAKDYDKMYEEFTNSMDKGLTRTKILNGRVTNAYMRAKDPSKPLTHENVELVRYEEDVKDLEVTEFYWLDENGNEIGSMMFKIARVYDENGNIVRLKGCTQVINPQGSPVYAGMPVIEKSTPTPDSTPLPDPTPDSTPTPEPTPDPTPEPTPDPTPTPETPTETAKPKDAENLQRIDNNINEQIAEEIGTEKVVITPTEEVTSAEVIKGPANQGYAPVTENAEGQEEADRNELSEEEVPSTDQEVDEYLNSIGI